MCTVVYAPYQGKRILASLRDESPKRHAAKAPAVVTGTDTKYLMPLDPLGGGTWIGVNDRRCAIVLMNGGFARHRQQPPYRMSRGVIVRKLLENKMPVVEWMLMPMEGIEPYTLIVYADGKLFRLTWDGQQKHRQTLDEHTYHIFSSATLYDDAAALKRKEYFDNWMAMDPPLDRLSLLNFFKSVKDSDQGFIINRNEIVKTLSYSYIEMERDVFTLHYYDFQKYKVDTAALRMADPFE